jgi:lipoprotein-anchoring transpeptidase ErfK/SrfK
VAIWENRTISSLLADISHISSQELQVLGDSSEEKWIEIDLSEQKLKAWQGSTLFLESLISSGLYNKTPVGEYRIWYKAKYTKMEGGVKGTKSYYYLPNVPFAMFFYGDFGIHGAYWHTNFGNRMSHGCVNAPTSVAEKLFYWTSPQLPEKKNSVRSTDTNLGTRVVIHD